MADVSGLIVYDENGNKISDVNTSLSRVIGALQVTAPWHETDPNRLKGSVSVPALANGIPWISVYSSDSNCWSDSAFFWIEGTTIYYQFPVPTRTVTQTSPEYGNYRTTMAIYGTY